MYLNESSLVNNLNYLNEIVIRGRNIKKPVIMPFETSRGCPYSCVYCEWGGGTGTKVTKKPFNIIKQDIDVISYLMFDDLEIIDANFGIFPQDIDILNYLLEQRRNSGYPKNIMLYGLAKVKSEKKEQILDALFREGLGTTYSMSLQSMDPEILKDAKRVDITTEEQIKLAEKYIKLYDARIKVEIIMGLPGSTIDSFYEEMDLFQITKIWYNSRNIYSLLPDTEAYSQEYRDKFKIKSAIIGSSENEEQIYYALSTGVVSKFKSSQEIVCGSYSYTTEEWKEMYFMNKAQRVLGPLLKDGQKASVEMRKVFQRIKEKSWYKEIDSWMDKIINNDLHDEDINMINGVFIERILENHLEDL